MRTKLGNGWVLGVVFLSVASTTWGWEGSPPVFGAGHHSGPTIGHHWRCDPSDPNACGPHRFCRIPDGICDSADVLGICTPVPLACPDVWQPVCGCDGVTYGNRCEARAHRMSIRHEGECPQVCDGFAGIPCDPNEFCLHPIGTCDVSDQQGVCVPVPNACPDIYLPVCGCDGLTYGNACDAIMAGVQIDHEGECAQVCGGIIGIPCDPGEFCKTPIGACCCDQFGVCTTIPFGCPDVWDPVCGCDGVTYGNACEADAAGVSVDHVGTCEIICDGIAGIQCPDGYFCKHPVGTCDFSDVQGVCTLIPLGCPDVWDPVCGCDGQTYSNECDADAASVNILHDGECAQICGGIIGIPCDPGEFCKTPIGECCCDHFGVCTTIPFGCPDVWDPVCGCDGVTYGNACEADAAGVSVDHVGACDQICDGFAGIPCDPGEFCLHPIGTCQVADEQGVCVGIPFTCPDVWMPVCGCDGVTYSNACEAIMAQVQVDHTGECSD